MMTIQLATVVMTLMFFGSKNSFAQENSGMQSTTREHSVNAARFDVTLVDPERKAKEREATVQVKVEGLKIVEPSKNVTINIP